MSRNTAAEAGYDLAGLQHPATIVIDTWGIAHIRAGSEMDAFLVQGFNAARERLWQMDLWRKRGLGLLAADFGPGYLAQDRAARLFLYRGDMDAEWAAYGPVPTKDIAASFARGINLWIELTEQRPELLAGEFARFGTRPQRWKPEDVVRIRSHARANNILSEVTRAHVTARGGADIDTFRKAIAPGHEVVASNADLAAIPLAVLDVYKLAISSVTFTKERMQASLADAWRWTKADEFGDVALSEMIEGSNNWAISGARTESGRPILANDPHRNYSLPALRYVVHLSAPGLNAIGAGEPCVPGISMGHNDTAAFGLTIFPMDQEDLYVYEINPENPDQYRYDGAWEPMRIVRESVPVKGSAPQDVVLKFTRHGPVIFEDGKHKVYAVRTVWSEPGAAAYVAALNYLKTTSVTQFVEAIGHWVAPPVNHVYADMKGDIAWTVAGQCPVRDTWDGLLPVGADGSREWKGFVPPEGLPRRINPAENYVATANELNAPAFPHLARESNERSRIDRIRKVLGAQPKHTLEQSMALQNDTTSMPARRLSAILAALALDGDAALARDILLDWDCTLAAAGQPAAALFEVWSTHCLKPTLLDALARSPAVRALLGPGDNETIVTLLEQPDERLPAAKRDRIIAATLTAALAKCRTLLGNDAATWSWGSLHRCTFNHPGAPLFGDNDNVCRDVGPLAVGGSSSTPMFANYKADSFDVFNGASYRMVLDVGNWDNCRAVNSPGQSGSAASKHYDDHAPLWAKGDYVPLLFTKAAVDAEAELVITLKPA